MKNSLTKSMDIVLTFQKTLMAKLDCGFALNIWCGCLDQFLFLDNASEGYMYLRSFEKDLSCFPCLATTGVFFHFSLKSMVTFEHDEPAKCKRRSVAYCLDEGNNRKWHLLFCK